MTQDMGGNGLERVEDREVSRGEQKDEEKVCANNSFPHCLSPTFCLYIQGFLTKSSQQLPGAGQFPPEACLQLKGAGITTKAVAKSRILGWGRRLNVSVEISKAQEIPAQRLCLRSELHLIVSQFIPSSFSFSL